ncbi:hypothetical protein [Caulobacter sp. 17J65-9]|uniref:hypothetical protein n=1 Tax=Caulobacter sp. 17J65-9 TaxID=2709382 RepID=UPI0013C8AEEB|nr:hypothetical protein [Caulobacter sp. 17J65-9]NEX92641.1 hypothetical protein [Caulobacter sp. 17J65-9]
MTLLAVLQAARSIGFYIQKIVQGQLAGAVFLLWALGAVGCVACCVLAIASALRARRRGAIGFGAAALTLGVLLIFVTL